MARSWRANGALTAFRKGGAPPNRGPTAVRRAPADCRNRCYKSRVLEFRILGPLEVVRDGVPLQLGGQKQRALLAILLLRANEVVATDRLVDELWGEQPPRTATTSLQNSI